MGGENVKQSVRFIVVRQRLGVCHGRSHLHLHFRRSCSGFVLLAGICLLAWNEGNVVRNEYALNEGLSKVCAGLVAGYQPRR